MKFNLEQFEGINPFHFSAKYIELDRNSPENEFDSHVHEECEIYVNLSGDVSFVVENTIYPVKPGDVIITRPFEYHHCVYHSDKLHKHFWILFSSSSNEYLFNSFFEREAGNANHLSFPPESTEKIVALCHELTKPEPLPGERYYRFFKLIHMLHHNGIAAETQTNYPPDVIYTLNYINCCFSQKITVSEIAKEANVSVNTLERHFKNILNISPCEYLKKKRLANAAELLVKGCSVTDASLRSGFADYSNFISIFKSAYGVTPLAYKKAKQEKSTPM
ncbi:MAG: AraC family transcriptional regulator [Ruminococcaceae bacterium]|nr:AraC family transcriptional regulator [Oscillospiraceae bacterium]